ncbi:MAG: prepilin-type N-terminal cleavage/methylation domain-containing protein [Candidatus Omnitrophica bacterium]|nr:prepilin-type N-terminal cleavage/methylation domain-containing protein [Candidatus Omnitrophota bacterium]
MSKKGFTLVEIVIVVIILGIVAGLGIPRLVGSQDKVIASEGIQAIKVLRDAQTRYCLEHSCSNGNYPGCGVLDVTISLKNFTGPYCMTDGSIDVSSIKYYDTQGHYVLGLFSGVWTCHYSLTNGSCSQTIQTMLDALNH